MILSLLLYLLCVATYIHTCMYIRIIIFIMCCYCTYVYIHVCMCSCIPCTVYVLLGISTFKIKYFMLTAFLMFTLC